MNGVPSAPQAAASSTLQAALANTASSSSSSSATGSGTPSLGLNNYKLTKGQIVSVNELLEGTGTTIRSSNGEAKGDTTTNEIAIATGTLTQDVINIIDRVLEIPSLPSVASGGGGSAAASRKRPAQETATFTVRGTDGKEHNIDPSTISAESSVSSAAAKKSDTSAQMVRFEMTPELAKLLADGSATTSIAPGTACVAA